NRRAGRPGTAASRARVRRPRRHRRLADRNQRDFADLHPRARRRVRHQYRRHRVRRDRGAPRVNAATGAAATDAAYALRTGSNDRLGVTFLFSLIAHAVIALGITFEYVKSAPQMPSLDVILVQSANAEKPAKADFPAQVANAGGGNSERALRPSDPLSGPLPKALAGIAPRPTETGAPKPTPPSRTEVLTSAHADVRVPNDEA